ncbi:MAG: hypothetical protein GX116_05670 [Fibrobacter sp.]|jgi:hypothetical protein|nr:hypothetical protein [Fibrobacter sp.]
MKTKLTSFFAICVLFLSASLYASETFYDKTLVRGFISFGGEYRNMSSEHVNYVNSLLFRHSSVIVDVDSNFVYLDLDSEARNYRKFTKHTIGLNINLGAEYKQLMTWFNLHFTPTQTSKKPAKFGDFNNKLYDARWYSYGLDWLFAWKLLNEQSVINLIPAAGLGFNLLNIHFPSNYDFIKVGTKTNLDALKGIGYEKSGVVSTKDRYYSNFAATAHAELELRLNIDPISFGVYGGYRYVRYSEFKITEGGNESWILGDPEVKGDAMFVGARLTWTFLSKRQKELKLKL